ncbi:MAG: MFS transporter [archaeon]
MAGGKSSFFKGVNKKEAWSWAFFDFANSSYSLIIFSFVFPIFFKDVIAGSKGDFLWGLIVSISVLLGGLAAPIIGAMADYDSRRKSKFIIFTLLAVLGTAALFFTGPNTVLLASLLFILTNSFFEIAIILYDSFLVSVSSRATAGRISGLGWGLGYLGGVVCMILLKPLYDAGYSAASASLYKLTFPLTALFFLIFSLPSFFFVREKVVRRTASFVQIAKKGFSDVMKTLRNVRKHRKIAKFFLAFYFLSDALVTLIAFVPIYARQTLSMSMSEIALILLVGQLIGVPATAFFGWLSDRKGCKKILLATIAMWLVIMMLLVTATSKTVFLIVGALTGLVIGSSQAVARAWLSRMIPRAKRSEFFGFSSLTNKISATIGPLIFGLVSLITSSQRWAMLSVVPFFIIAFVIFAGIKE